MTSSTHLTYIYSANKYYTITSTIMEEVHIGRDYYINPTIFKGQVLTHVRLYLKNSDGVLIPQKGKGITLKHDEVKKLAKVLPQVRKQIAQLEAENNNDTDTDIDEHSTKRKRKVDSSDDEEIKKERNLSDDPGCDKKKIKKK